MLACGAVLPARPRDLPGDPGNPAHGKGGHIAVICTPQLPRGSVLVLPHILASGCFETGPTE